MYEMSMRNLGNENFGIIHAIYSWLKTRSSLIYAIIFKSTSSNFQSNKHTNEKKN